MTSRNHDAVFLEPDIAWHRDSRGDIVMYSNTPLGEYENSIVDYLVHWAEQRPDTVFIAERNSEGIWQKITYRETLTKCQRLAGKLSQLNVSADHPVMIISGNSVASALLILASMYVGVPVVLASPSYSLLSKDFAKLKHISKETQPGLIFAEKIEPFRAALATILNDAAVLVTTDDDIEQSGFLPFGTLTCGDDVAQHRPGIPDDVAKILYTSGSTGLPKGVLNTNRMLTSNQEAIGTIWPFLNHEGHVLLDWLPWHHTFGGNHNFNMVIRNGATLYIDGGKPHPALIEQTVTNLGEISPTLYFNVTAGYNMLLPHLESNDELARRFFKRMRLLFFAAAALPRVTWDRLEALKRQHSTREIPLTSSWGCTETAPLATSVYFHNSVNNNIGVPVPGTSIKLANVSGKLEIRVKGPNVTPGYVGVDADKLSAFDEDGYYRSGDAVRLADEQDPSLGILFAGRLGENFKLNSGTWVNVGELRMDLVSALSPLASDVVIVGESQAALSLLIFPHEKVCEDLDAAQVAVESSLFEHNKTNLGASRRIDRALILKTPPSIDANEITDKGYINQKMVILNRADDVSHLLEPDNHKDVIEISPAKSAI